MKRFIIGFVCLVIAGCATVSTQVATFDKEQHEAILKMAKERIKWVSCDIGLIDGLGIAVAADFPIWNVRQVQAILPNPGISLALGEIKQIAQNQIDPVTGYAYWKSSDYNLCKIEGLSWRTAALGTIDVLRLFPQLAPYLGIFGPIK